MSAQCPHTFLMAWRAFQTRPSITALSRAMIVVGGNEYTWPIDERWEHPDPMDSSEISAMTAKAQHGSVAVKTRLAPICA